MTAYRGRRCVPPLILHLVTSQKVSGQHHALDATRGKEIRCPEQVWMLSVTRNIVFP